MLYATIVKGKLGGVTPPGGQPGHSGSTSVETKNQPPLARSQPRLFPLAVVALSAAAFGSTLRVEPQDVPAPIAGALGQVQAVENNSGGDSNSTEAIGLLVTLEARSGKEADAETFLKSAQPLALNEKGTLKWYAVKLGPGKFGIFDTFANEDGRNAHLNGEIAKALGARANELFATPPQIAKTEVLATTPLKQGQSAGDSSITIQNKAGVFHINITPPLTTYKLAPSDLNHITDNDYVGVASTQGADGKELAKQIFVFPSEFRGAVEGSVLLDPQPGAASQSRMTNGSVSVQHTASRSRMTNGVVQKGRGTTFVVRYQDGEQTISVPANVPVVRVVPGEVQLAAGETAYAKTEKQTDGTLTTHMILVIGGPSSK
jgi:quinol monooxygenase YgiN